MTWGRQVCSVIRQQTLEPEWTADRWYGCALRMLPTRDTAVTSIASLPPLPDDECQQRLKVLSLQLPSVCGNDHAPALATTKASMAQ